jgi:guanylate cyclase
MTEMRDNGTVAFIGPDDTCRSEALVAAAWNLPMISYVSLHVSNASVALSFQYLVANLLRAGVVDPE